MGPAPIGGPALFVQDNAGLVFVQAVDGQWYVEYDRWWETEKMLVVLTGRLVKANDDPIGTIGSFGYLYYAGELPAWLLEEYDIQFLENDIYCYKIK
jgi:hypothetical protein